ncbi:MAG: cupin domain-containing protein [Rhizobiaceae bacterium]
MHFKTLNIDGIEVELGGPAADRIVTGSPQFRTWSVEERDGLYAGVWESTPGSWRIQYDEWEYCRILSGVSIIHEDGGTASRVGPGDSFILQPGFRGVWEVIETTCKEYVIRL